MIRIEILSVDGTQVSAAFYYPVPDNIYSSNSVDPNRAASGSGLDATELQLLRDGKLYEITHTGDSKGKTTAQIKSALETMWNDLKNVARNEYVVNFSYTGSTWDGNTWQS